jgi:hypothetical protein
VTHAPAPVRSRLTPPVFMARLFPGDRRVWLAAGAVLAIGATAVLVALLVPRDYYTGTNSVRSRSFEEAPLERGDQLCVPGLDVPAGTGRVQLQIDAAGAPLPALTGSLTIDGRASPPAQVPASPTPGPRKVEFAVPQRPASPESVRGTLCVRAYGKVQFGGMPGLQGNDVAPTVSGKQLATRIAVWYLPRAGQKRRLISHFGEILGRASLFRPSFVSPAFYWLLLLVWMPLLAYAGVRLLAIAPERSLRRLTLWVALLAFANAAAWAFVTPPFNSPDESEHFAYVQWFAETGNAVARQVRPDRPVYSTDQTYALEATRLFSSSETADGDPPWLRIDEERWRQRVAESPRPPPRDNGGGSTAATTSHTPAYYATLAPAYLATSGGSVWDQLTAARLTSALYAAIAALCAFLVVRELVPRQPVLAAGAGLLVGFHPMFGFMAGSVNNDNGLNAAAAVVIWLVVRAFRRGLTWRTGIALGAAIAVMPILKGTGYALYPLLLLALPVLLWRRHSRRDLIAIAAVVGTFLVAGAAWSALSSAFDQSLVTTPGGATPGGGARANVFGYLSYLWQVFFPTLPFMTELHHTSWPFFDIYIVRGWGAFGWYAESFPLWVYKLIAAATAGVGVLGVRVLWRYRDRVRRDWPAVAFVALVPLVVIAAVEAAYYSPDRRAVIPEFGRYLFPAMAPLAAMAVGACSAFGRRWAGIAAAALVAAVVVIDYAAQLLTLAGFYSL